MYNFCFFFLVLPLIRTFFINDILVQSTKVVEIRYGNFYEIYNLTLSVLLTKHQMPSIRKCLSLTIIY